MTNRQGITNPSASIADLYEAFVTGNPDPALAPFNDDSVWIETGDNLRSGVFRGPAEITKHGLHLRAMTDGTWGTDVLEILGGHKFVVVVERALALRNGTSLNVVCNTVYEVANGSITEMRVLPFDPVAWDQFWS